MRQTNHTTVHADYLYYVTLGNTDRVSASSIVGFFHAFSCDQKQGMEKERKRKKRKKGQIKNDALQKLARKALSLFPEKEEGRKNLLLNLLTALCPSDFRENCAKKRRETGEGADSP